MLGPDQSLPTLCKLQHMHLIAVKLYRQNSDAFLGLSVCVYKVKHLWSSPHTTLNTLLRNSSAMGFHSMLVQLTWVGVILSFMAAAATATAFLLALTNRTDRCGDVKIPYPLWYNWRLFPQWNSRFFWSIVATRPANLNHWLETWRLQTYPSKARLKSWCLRLKTVTITQMVRVDEKPQQISRYPVSQFLSSKTSSWPLAVTLTHSLMII